MASYKSFLVVFLLVSLVLVSESADYGGRVVQGPKTRTVVKKVLRNRVPQPVPKRKTIFDAAADIANGILG